MRKSAGEDKNFDYSTLTDAQAEFGRVDTIKDKVFYILPSELFNNVRKGARSNPNLNESLAAIFNNIENSAKGSDSEDDLKGLFDDLDVNSNKLEGSVDKSCKYQTYILGLKAKSYVNSGMGNPKLMSHILSKIKILVLPIEDQEEIVKILDTFTELEARKKQYEYYRNKLLKFKPYTG